MEELNLFENTLLILLSDHGVAHGEHGYTGKPDYVLWPEITDIPFFIRHPEGKGAGETSDYYASTHDVAPTILGYLGIEPPQELDGQDLSVLLEGGEPEARPHFTIGYNDHVWARDDRYVMFSTNQGADAKLYDVQRRPRHAQRHRRGRAQHRQADVRRLHAKGRRRPLAHLRLRHRRRIEPSSVLPPCSKHVRLLLECPLHLLHRGRDHLPDARPHPQRRRPVVGRLAPVDQDHPST